MKNKKKKGFTLIELLIVIAIIGILASIVLVSLGSARKKAQIAAAKSSIASVISVAQICRDNAGSIQDGNAGDLICDSPAASGGTDATWPQINPCGPATTDTAYTVTDGGTDTWIYELSTCTNMSDCVGAAVANCSGQGAGCYFVGTCT